MAYLKLMAAIMMALFATGLGKPPAKKDKGRPKLLKGPHEICLDLKSAMEKLSPNEEAKAEKTFALAESVFKSFNEKWGNKGNELKTALAAVAHRSNCSDSRLDIVETIAYCRLWESQSTKSLDKATRKYARKCFSPQYIKDTVSSSISKFGKMEVTELIDHQFFVDYKSEFPKDKQMSYGTMDGQKFAKALAKAVIRDPKEDITKLKSEKDVFGYLEESLFKPCLIYRLALNRVFSPFYGILSVYLGGYEKFFSSLDESTREQFSRRLFCSNLLSSNRVDRDHLSRKVLHHLQSASAQ